MMNKQRMVEMLTMAKEAVQEAELESLPHPGAYQLGSDGRRHKAVSASAQNLIGQLILASAIEESGRSISLCIGKLDKIAHELGEIAKFL